MISKAGILGAVLGGMAAIAHAYTSGYSSMAVPGDHNDWSTAPSMVLMANGTWVCTQTLSSADGSFQFTANGNWDDSWGGAASIVRVPAVASAPVFGGDPLSYAGFTPGAYRFIFNEITLECRVEWAGVSPLPVPAVTNLAVIGDFNGWTPNANSLLTNHPAPNIHVWSGSILLEKATPFQFLSNNNPDQQWGSPKPITIIAPTNGNTCGQSYFMLAGVNPGLYRFELNVSNNTFSVIQTASMAVDNLVVQGSFIGTNQPPPNMMRGGGGSLWESDHHITNTAPITLRFVSGSNFVWGVTNGAGSFTQPASGAMSIGQTNYATVTGLQPGRYRITLDHLTGDFSFRRQYLDNSMGTGANLLKNPGFEKTSDPNGGVAVDWGSYQSWPHSVAINQVAPHAGNWCGAIHGQLYPDWSDFGSFAQDVAVETGRTYRASAWFKATPDWSANSMQIKLEWLTISNTSAGEAIANIPALTTNWVKYYVDGTAPSNATKAHVVFLCANAETAGKMHIDDAEMRVLAGRMQDFEGWSTLLSYAPYAPDWSVTSGKVMYNIPPGRPPAGVLISQYIEGTGNNKAVEIFNGTLADLNLGAGGYVLQQYNNGATSPSVTIPLSGTVPAGGTLVVGRPNTPLAYKPDPAIGNQPNLFTNKYLTFNGDDVVVLLQGSTVLDRVGQVGTNATGSIWSRNTKDRTLTRKQTIFTGTVGAVTAAFPIDEWEISAQDDFTGLGSHDLSYVDPNEPYTPGGFSLLMNTNAILMSGEMSGGIGDLSFWYRTETTNVPITVLIESAPSDTGPWVLQNTISNFARGYFTNMAFAINRPDHLYVRWRQTAGAPNRFRIDDIVVGEYFTVKRLEDFNLWTDPAYNRAGTYSRYGWTIQNASIAPSSGVSATQAALLSPPDGAVISPAYDGGVGETLFWAQAADTNNPAYLLLQSTVDGGTNWITQASFTVTAGALYNTWLYLPESGAQVRLVFDPGRNSDDVLIDNFEVRVPALYRTQNFNGWPTRTSYTDDSYQGWIVSNSIVDSQNAFEGQAARLNTTVGNYIQSPYLPGGIGALSFRIRKWAATDNVTVQVQTSPDAKTWTTVASISPASTTYEQINWYLGTTNHFFVRLYHSAGAFRVLVDDIVCGVYQPRPEILATPSLSPPTPLTNQPTWVMADIITRYGSAILSVTGTYQVASSSPNHSGMAPIEFGSYRTTNAIPGQPLGGTRIRYMVTIRYAGVGANPASPGYATNTYTSPWYTNYVATIDPGDIWVNEIFYAPYGPDEPYEYINICDPPCDPCNFESPCWSNIVDVLLLTNGCNHEYIELCGVEGTDLSGWTIQFAFGSDADIAVNSNNPVYASYKIPTNTILTNRANGYGFYVLGDAELATNAPIDQALTNAIPEPPPSFMVPVWPKDHIYDGVGVIRLLDQFGNLFYSLSYRGFASGSDRIPQNQLFSHETNSIGLSYDGDTYNDFDWEKGEPSIGVPNEGQILLEREPPTNEYANAWHHQPLLITPVNTNLFAPFTMLDPWPPGHFHNIGVFFGFTAAAYPSAGGLLHHRPAGGAWSTLGMNIPDGAGDNIGNGYARAIISAHTYERLVTLEYVIEVIPNKAGVLNVYLGSDSGGENISTIYTNLTEAKSSPFTYRIPIADVITITNLAVSATNVTLWTGGNDPIAPLVNFQIQAASNVLTQYRYLYDENTNIIGTTTNTVWGVWTVTNHSGYTNIYREWIFNIRRNTNDKPARFYRVVPLWP
ncbi:MAG TPA: lamin tail domain-containing protein [Kiritimatiellia bacterium]|nr:lamin tail domain-containing protein [Kiritimatiellia bacterium]